MISITDDIKISIPELEEDNSFMFVRLIIKYGCNGIIPSFYLMVSGQNKEVKFRNISLKVIVDGIIICDCKGVIIKYEINDAQYTFSGYLVNSFELLYDSTPYVYDSLVEAVQSIWKYGKINIQIPNVPNANLAQCREQNILYLSKILKASSSDSIFYYGLFNDISEFSLTKTIVTKDFINDTNGVSIATVKDATAELSGNPNMYRDSHSASTGQFATAILGDRVFITQSNNLRLSENTFESSIKISRGGTDFRIVYPKPGIIDLGDICSFKMTDTTIVKLRAMSTTFSIDHQEVKCTTLTNHV